MTTLALSSCQTKQNSKTKTLRISFHMDPTTVDPRKTGDLAASALSFLLFSGLTRQQPDGSIQCAIAKSYDISEDEKTYTFHLRDAYWSDGQPITAYDFEYSWKKILDPSFPSLCPQLFYPIKNAKQAAQKQVSLDEIGVKALDDKTFQVELEQPTPYFLALTSFCIFYPIPYHIEAQNTKWDQDLTQLVTNGPFLLEVFKPNNEIIIKKNPTYWDQDLTKLDKIHIAIVDNENTALNLFENNELDWIGTPLSPLPTDAIPALKSRKEFMTSPISGTLFCNFKMDHPLLSNKNLRKALSYSMNRQSIVDNISQQNECIATRCIPPVMYQNHNQQMIDDNNQQLANTHLEKALKELQITKDQVQLTLIYGPSTLHKKIAATLKNQWEKALGIQIVLRQLEEKVLRDCLYHHQFDISLFYWIAQYYDPINILERFMYKDHPKNYPGWQDTHYISLLEQSFSETNVVKRKALLTQAEFHIMDELPICPIYHMNYSIMTHPRVSEVSIGPIGEMFFEKAIIK